MMQGLIEFLPTIRRIHHGHGIMAQALRDELAAHGARKPLVLLARALLGTAVWGRVMPEEVERMELEVLGQSFPQAASLLKVFAST